MITRRGKVALLLAVIGGLVLAYYLMKWTTPKDCLVPLNRMSQECKDFIYPE